MLEGVPPPHTQDLMVPALRLSELDGSSPKFIAKWFQPQPHNQMVPAAHSGSYGSSPTTED